MFNKVAKNNNNKETRIEQRNYNAKATKQHRISYSVGDSKCLLLGCTFVQGNFL